MAARFAKHLDMRVVAIIPARGGSIGLPGKNIKPLNGVPLLGRTVLAAKNAKSVSEVYVSSDSLEILAVGKNYGAIPILRPEELSGSTASSESALLHALDFAGGKNIEPPEIVVFLQCTSPFVSSGQIDKVVSQLLDEDASSAFAAVEDHGFIWSIGDDGLAEGVTHDHTKPRQRRQDMKPRYRETGAIYAMKVLNFLEDKNRFCGKTILVPCEMHPLEIDSPQDWAVAEALVSIFDPIKIAQKKPAKKLKALVTDFDGVHTDDLVIVNQDGSESVRCSRSDGMGLEILRKAGLKLLILSREENPVVRTRANKLRMDVQHHVLDKMSGMTTWRLENNLEWDEIAYIGNDINDLECMEKCGLSFAPSDAHHDICKIADIVLTRPGGKGALRELSEYLISNKLLG
ncbi:acylneuraminate cytidylyltransferase [Neorhizobium alkalisoli]|uniref:acylneuraminate cytidylyltransferase n=1 Tax=Neorhizobium alkalisoli TaxID=528178 RepID=UPI000CF991F3|nr:acylneuraminate cytidylyltransferase [Neorhizobium alkalisoli]